MNLSLRDLHAAVLALAFALGAAPAGAARLDDHQLKTQLARFDLGCLSQVDMLPGPAKTYQAPAVCSCAHKSMIAGLKSAELEQPATLAAADQQKITQLGQHAVWSCAQASYARAMKPMVHGECLLNIRDTPSAHGLSDSQVGDLCNCMADQFTRTDPPMLNKPDQAKMQAFADTTLQNSFTACKAQIPQ